MTPMNTITGTIVHQFVDCHLLKGRQKTNSIVLLPQQHKTASALWCALHHAFSESHSDILFVVRDLRQFHQTEAMLNDLIVPEFCEMHGTAIHKCGNLFQHHEEAARIHTYRLPNASQVHFCVMNITAARHFTQHKPQCVILDNAVQGITPAAVTEFVNITTEESTAVLYFLSAPVYVEESDGSIIRFHDSHEHIETPRHYELSESTSTVYMWSDKEERLLEWRVDKIEVADSESVKRNDVPLIASLSFDKP